MKADEIEQKKKIPERIWSAYLPVQSDQTLYCHD